MLRRLPTLSIFKSTALVSTVATASAGDVNVSVDAAGQNLSRDGATLDGSKVASGDGRSVPVRKSRTHRAHWARESLLALVRRRSTVDRKEDQQAQEEGDIEAPYAIPI